MTVAQQLLGDAAPAPFAPRGPGRKVVYRGATVIDGTGTPGRQGLAVVTDGELISELVPDSDLATDQRWADAETVDLAGGFLLPVLIDSHQHLATPPHRAAALDALGLQADGGVTAIRVMADDIRQVADLARAARVGEIKAPDVFYAALMAGPSFFDDPRTHAVTAGLEAGAVPWMQAVAADTDLVEAVTLARGTGATAIKIYADLAAELVAAITAEAHRQGLPVWAHGAVFPARPGEVVGAGVDSVSHVSMLAYQAFTGEMPRTYATHRPVMPAALSALGTIGVAALDPLLDEMAGRGCILDATVSMTEHGHLTDHADLVAEITARAFERGVSISTGTDYGSAADAEHPTLHNELRFLSERVGMPTAEVIRSATQVGARSLGLQDVMGTIEPGKLANLVITGADPLADITNLRTITGTIKRGTAIPAAGAARSTTPTEEPA